jgi:magnesium-transporting ATPase (P-type)
LLNRTVLRRAFAVFGPTEALLSMTAFVCSFVVAGWRPGDPFPEGDVAAAASGAAFLTVVLCQAANAFACRSTSRRPSELGWTTNRLLPFAVAAGTIFSLVVLLVPPIARHFDHAAPPPVGWLIAIGSAPLLLLVDAIDKGRRRGRTPGPPTHRPVAVDPP